MKKFILKVQKRDNFVSSYSKHHYGGIDVEQETAFIHIFGEVKVDTFYFDAYVHLVKLHGWELEFVKDK